MSLIIRENIPLAPLTTFRVGGPARYFAEVGSREDLKEASAWAIEKQCPVFIFGGGSNVLVSDEGFLGLVIRPNFLGKEIVREDGESVRIRLGSGEVWDEMVAWTVENNWWGIENLSHIPGRVGGLAVQNVGAYGQEASQVVDSVEAWDIQDQKVRIFQKEECLFRYRQSIFNVEEKGTYVIISIVLKLSKIASPKLDYPDLKKCLESNVSPSIGDIRRCIISIRDAKFPFPREAQNGNAGSFFKNLVLTQDLYSILESSVAKNIPLALPKLQEIKKKFPDQTGIKIPTAFLIDICGLKGASVGGAKINEKQPLVILNYTGKAMAKDILALADQVIATLHEKTGMRVEREVEWVGATSNRATNPPRSPFDKGEEDVVTPSLVKGRIGVGFVARGLNLPYNQKLKILARENRKNSTPSESKMWNDVLRRRQCKGHTFLRQKPMGRFILDFYCSELLLGIEIDGNYHTDQEIKENDEERSELLKEFGIQVIRYTNEEVLENIEGVREDLGKRVGEREQ
ncbi:MAG: UDP-N-acetylmuramate dehydrogenase [Parcubacteria group bacterium Gr01-1014_18]|nr:MAG: UDP-N-acetylmuramate dehydrogenase [Parcubacteria group bacterium Greene0416_36]TSC81111.1 MAG: UDP-N-acetylmuramate dehydrogenase [Parcubacteria group bacterium Gr01-1014_18]TSC98473.1 MAG: UDP-N-acetylmuramate dehydrogenase [Parcubacteria group bacterium Greene1014_20]TSD07362.1 MAG: UDP-N-acetylmuramate dehydrogenase [Parcubacteria group bacterium Greene0714_2]